MTLTRKFNAQAARSGADETMREKEDESARAGHVLSRFWRGGAKSAAVEPELPHNQPTQQEKRFREAVAQRLLRTPRAP
jgi:hypothetical protein